MPSEHGATFETASLVLGAFLLQRRLSRHRASKALRLRSSAAHRRRFSAVLRRPMERPMESDQPPKPIISSYAADPELEERIDAFVIRLGERVDQLQDVEIDGDLALLRELAESFGTESRELGYEPLALAADRVAAACLEQSPEAARKSLMDLTEVSQRVRRGHSSSA